MACRLCHELFYDTPSLLLHTESHLSDGTSTSGQDRKIPAPLPSVMPSSSNSSGSSHPNEWGMRARHIETPRMENHAKEGSSSLPSAPTPHTFLRGVSRIQVPDLNSRPPSIPSFSALRRTHFENIAAASPFFNPQVPACSLTLGLATVPLDNPNKGDQIPNRTSLQIKETETDVDRLIRACEERYRKNKRKLESDLEGPAKVDDGEEDKDKKPEELDLTLKL